MSPVDDRVVGSSRRFATLRCICRTLRGCPPARRLVIGLFRSVLDGTDEPFYHILEFPFQTVKDRRLWPEMTAEPAPPPPAASSASGSRRPTPSADGRRRSPSRHIAIATCRRWHRSRRTSGTARSRQPGCVLLQRSDDLFFRKPALRMSVSSENGLYPKPGALKESRSSTTSPFLCVQ